MLLSSFRTGILALPIFYAMVSGKDVFTKPGAEKTDRSYRNNEVYQDGGTVEVEWTSDTDFVDLVLVQQYPDIGLGYYWSRVVIGKVFLFSKL
jgi:hypothetical protein